MRNMPTTILVAEDDAEDAFLLERAFARAGVGARMDFVHDGAEAIEYLRGDDRFKDRKAHPLPHLMLLDLKMPKVDGFDVLRWLQNQPGLKRLVVTVLSSSTEPRDINLAYDLGAKSYLVKPSVSDDLFDLVRRIQSYWCEVNQPPDCTWREE
jgi:CheY-like chemotaxis protein